MPSPMQHCGPTTDGGLRHVHLGEIVTARRAGALISTGLGAGVAICVYDPLVRVGALLHVLLPSSKLDPEAARRRPTLYADLGVAILIATLEEAGANRGRLRSSVVGGATVPGECGPLSLGSQNVHAVREALRVAAIPVIGERVGGAISRAVLMMVATGALRVSRALAGSRV